MDIYRIKYHLQPLQLFKVHELKGRLLVAPRYLVDSFLALTVRHSTHAFYRGQQSQAVELYATSARQTVMDLASQGIPRLEIVQALCLLVLVDITGESIGRLTSS